MGTKSERMVLTMGKKTSYISTLLTPRPEQAQDKRAWSLPVHGVWVPFFTATNVAGETNIAPEDLGAPVRLAREKDGSARFSEGGKPVLRIAKGLNDQVRIVRENFAAGLLAYAQGVVKAQPEAYKAQVDLNAKKGAVIHDLELKVLQDTIDARLAAAQAQAEAAAAQGEAAAPIAPEPELVAA